MIEIGTKKDYNDLIMIKGRVELCQSPAFQKASPFPHNVEIMTNNIRKEYYLTEVPELLRKKGKKVLTYRIKDGADLKGVNTLEDLKLCEAELLKRKVIK